MASHPTRRFRKDPRHGGFFQWQSPCRRCGNPAWSGQRDKTRGLLCPRCDRKELAEIERSALSPSPGPDTSRRPDHDSPGSFER